MLPSNQIDGHMSNVSTCIQNIFVLGNNLLNVYIYITPNIKKVLAEIKLILT